MDDLIGNPAPLDAVLNFRRDSLSEARSELSQIKHPNWLAAEINIVGVTNEERFAELIKEAKERKGPRTL